MPVKAPLMKDFKCVVATGHIFGYELEGGLPTAEKWG